VKVVPQRITGTLTEWKSTFGFITPDKPIDHPENRKGKIFVVQDDVEQDIAALNARVSFFCYSDGTGNLGAMNVRPSAAAVPLVQKTIQKTQPAFGSAPRAGKDVGKGAKAAGKAVGKAVGKGAKSAGKGKKGEPREQVAPDKSAREEVVAEPVEGLVMRSHGKVCFIQPDVAIDHPEASKHKGQIYLHEDDMEEGETEFPLAGAKVMFTVYTDGGGLGAEHVSVLEQGSGERPTIQAEEGAAADTSGVLKHSLKKGKGKPEKGKGKGKAKGKGKGKKERGPSGPDLERERITTEPVMGEVSVWKDKFGYGFIKPADEIDHPEASKHEGMLYINKKDVAEGVEMQAGLQILFHIFQDASGLGAEECMTC